MQDFDLIFSVLDKQETSIEAAVLTGLLNKEHKTTFQQQEVLDMLEQDYRATEVDPGLFYSTARLVDGVSFFAIPELAEIKEGKLSLIGAELFYFLKPAFSKESVQLDTGSGLLQGNISLEDSDFFLLRGLRDWYTEVGFEGGDDVVLIKVEDFAGARYSINRVAAADFEKLMESDLPGKIVEYTLQLFKEAEEVAPDELEYAPQEMLPLTGILQTMLYREVFDFAAFPCNLSFFFSDSEILAINGNRVILRSDEQEDFSPFYLGGNGEIPTELLENDLDELEQALTLLFMDGKPKKAASILKELKLKYPGERILNKFLYQAAYFMEHDEDILHYTTEYMSSFPADPDPHRTRGEVYFRQGKLEEADHSLQESLRLIHPQDKSFLSEVYTLLMYLRWETGDENGAMEMASKALAATPQNEEVLDFLAEVEMEPDEVDTTENGKVIKVDFTDKNKFSGGPQG